MVIDHSVAILAQGILFVLSSYTLLGFSLAAMGNCCPVNLCEDAEREREEVVPPMLLGRLEVAESSPPGEAEEKTPEAAAEASAQEDGDSSSEVAGSSPPVEAEKPEAAAEARSCRSSWEASRDVTLFATHYLRSFHAKTRERKLASAVLFWDVKSAFHSMIWQILFGSAQELPVHLQALLREAGCDLDTLRQAFDQTSAPFHCDVPVADRRLLQDAHLFTWFGLTGTDEAFCTARGSRPGSPLADVAFNAMMTGVLQEPQHRLEACSNLQRGFHALGLRAPPIAWADDVAVPIVATHCDILKNMLAEVAHITHDVFLRFGLSLNFKAKKTEAVVSFRDHSAPAHRHSLFVERLGKLDVPPLSMQIQCVASYEHLGTIFAAD